MIENISKEYFDKGVFVFENGKYLYIEEIQYSSDGTYWEDTFIPSSHVDPRDLTSTLAGHKYRRVRHAGDTYFQKPEYIVAEDGKTPVFRVLDEMLQVKYLDESDDSYTDLYDISALKGAKGDDGNIGRSLEITTAGWYYEMTACCGVSTVPSCPSCSDSSGSSSSSSLTTFLSLGDGLHEITSTDIGLYRSSDSVTWVEITASDVGSFYRYFSDSATGVPFKDFRDVDFANTRGKVYACTEDGWKEISSIATPYYKLAPTEAYFVASTNGFYMEDYVGEAYISSPDDGHTVYMDSVFDLRIKENSIEPKHLKDGIFSDGLYEGTVGPEGYKSSNIRVESGDFSGFGLKSYVSDMDAYSDMQVDVTDLLGDGLIVYDDNSNAVDGEDRRLASVNLSDLVDTSLSGLTTFENTDGFDDLIVKTYNGLEITTDGLGVSADELSVTVLDTNNEVKIKTYASGNDGVLPIHLNPTVAGDGLMQDAITKALYVYPDQIDNTIQVSNTRGVYVPDNGIEVQHLNDNILNELDNNAGIGSGLRFTHDDGVSVKLKASGGILKDGDGLYLDDADLLTGNCVLSLNSQVDDVTITASENVTPSTSGFDLTATTTSGNVDIELNLDKNKVKKWLDISSYTGGVTNDIDASWGTTSEIKTYIDTQDALDAKLDIVYGSNFKINAANGLLLKAPDGTWRKLIIADDYGNLATTAI
ncbi:MAG: hypothetical protein U9O94_10960 [Nanoarchaeota archaeon]|nr:hypothetical protein [Nanoarchaeota archaeon]